MGKVLYIEDKANWHAIITRIVRAEGHDLTIAENKEKARSYLESYAPEHRFNFIILDLSLREWSVELEGIDLLDLTDKKVEEQGTCVVVLTGTADPAKRQMVSKAHKVASIFDKRDFGRGDDLKQILRR